MVSKTPFKVAGEINLMTVSQRQMAAAIGLSATRVNQLIDEGILIRDPSTTQGRLLLFESLSNFFQARKPASEGANFWQERALHEKAKRELAELKVSERHGELYEALTVESTLIELLTDFRTKLLGLGHKLSPRLEGLTAAQMSMIIDGEVENILKELSDGAESANFNGDVATSIEDAAASDG